MSILPTISYQLNYMQKNNIIWIPLAILPAVSLLSFIIGKGVEYILCGNSSIYLFLLYILIFYLPLFAFCIVMHRRNYQTKQLALNTYLVFYIKAELSAVLIVMIIMFGFLLFTKSTIHTWIFILLFSVTQIPATIILKRDIELILKPQILKK